MSRKKTTSWIRPGPITRTAQPMLLPRLHILSLLFKGGVTNYQQLYLQGQALRRQTNQWNYDYEELMLTYLSMLTHLITGWLTQRLPTQNQQQPPPGPYIILERVLPPEHNGKRKGWLPIPYSVSSCPDVNSSSCFLCFYHVVRSGWQPNGSTGKESMVVRIAALVVSSHLCPALFNVCKYSLQ